MLIKPPLIDTNQDLGLQHRSPIITSPQSHRPILPKYHWSREPVDSRDLIFSAVPSSTIPNTVDLRQWCSPVDNQGNLGSCTGNAIAGCIEYMDRRYDNKASQVSRLFIYYYERVFEGTVKTDSGAYIRDGIKVTYTYGAPLESLWPYNISKFTTTPTSSAIADAARRKVTLYESVPDFNTCINAIAMGYPVVIGFDVYSSFETASMAQTGIMPYPNVNKENLLGGHCVLLVGYDNVNQHFIVRNSWGPNWGIHGYFYMPYQVIQNRSMSSDFWVIKTVNDP
jgi:C1A family cysteine protease